MEEKQVNIPEESAEENTVNMKDLTIETETVVPPTEEPANDRADGSPGKEVKLSEKNRLILEVAGIIVIVLLIATSVGSVSKTEYNSLKADYDSLQADYDAMAAELDSANASLEGVRSEYGEYKEKMKAFDELSDEEIDALIAYAEQAAAEKKAAEEAAEKEAAAEKKKQEDLAKATYYSGTYKVGTDIPAGEYVLFASGNGGYFSLNSDSSGSFDSIICNDNFDYNTIVTISDGQYFELKRGKAIPIDKNPTVDTSREGMFKVGLHIPAGEYKLTSSDGGYLQVSSDSSHSFDSIITNDNFEGEKYITVSDGQYLTITRAKIVN